MARLSNVDSVHREHGDPSASCDGKSLQAIREM